MAQTTSFVEHGFLFAFYRFSQLEHANLVERVVRVLTASDIIHVAVVPVHGCVLAHPPHHHAAAEQQQQEPQNNNCCMTTTTMMMMHEEEEEEEPVVVCAHAAHTSYTAYIGYGFEEQATPVVLTPEYDLMFLPVRERSDMLAGIRFLRSLRGARYNYRALPLTILPRAWKQHAPTWLTQETGQAHEHARIFCSQMGLMLCYVCNALPHYELDPAGCAPGELAQILRDHGGAIACDHACVQVLSPEQVAEAEEEAS